MKSLNREKQSKDVQKKILQEQIEKAEIMCKKFGCEKLLNPTEKLFSDFCFHHMQEENQKIKKWPYVEDDL